jgi:hypothetical protein
MHPDKQAAVLINEVDSMIHYIEALPAHPAYTDALIAIEQAKQKLVEGRMDLHQTAMRERFAQMDGHPQS